MRKTNKPKKERQSKELEKVKNLRKVKNEPDFIYSPVHGNSLKKVLDRYPNGVPEEKIPKFLLMTEEEVDKTYRSAIVKVRNYLGVDPNLPIDSLKKKDKK